MQKILLFVIISSLVFCSFVSTVFANENFNISAKSAVLMCMDTGEILFEKAATQKLPMASTTKIMTALILAEQPDLSKTVKVTKQMITVEGSSMGLLEGDTVSYRDLLYGMLLASGNDAANVTAYLLGGSIKGFAKIMNKKAAELGLENTSFVTPSGLDDEKHYTTACDLAKLTSFAIQNAAFRTACSSKQAVLYYGNPPYKRTLTNHNKLLESYNGLIGVKTGFTKKSGRCLVTAAERNGKRVIAVTLNAADDWNDHRTLLDYGLNVTSVVSFSNNDLTDVLPVISGDSDLVRIKSEEKSICTADKSVKNIKRRVILPEFIYAPIKAGERVGRVEYLLDAEVIATSNIYSVADLPIKNRKEKFLSRFLKSLNLIWNNS